MHSRKYFRKDHLQISGMLRCSLLFVPADTGSIQHLILRKVAQQCIIVRNEFQK